MPRYYNRVKELEPNRKRTAYLFPAPADKYNTLPYEYRYKFNPLPPQKDRVMGLIIKTMNELAKTDMYFAAASIRVWNADETPPLWPPRPGYWKNSKRQVKLYAFKESYEEFPMTVPISIKRAPGQLSMERIQVKPARKGPWVDLKVWLVSCYEHGYDSLEIVQQKWWRRTGKPFNFMGLPEELRRIIYRHILGSEIYPSVECADSTGTEDLKVCLGKGLKHEPYDYGVPTWASFKEIFAYRKPKTTIYVQPPNYNFLRVHSQLRLEALKAAWEGTRKLFLDSSDLMSVVNCSNAPPYNWLSKVQLNFDAADYFNFFGVSVHPMIQHDPNNCAARFLKASTIKDLEIRFRHPRIGWESDPWGAKLESFREDGLWDERKKHKMGCSKVVTDWILTFAFQYVKHIPKIKFTGSIKTEINEKWTRILDQEYMQRNDDVKSHDFGYQTEIDRILEIPQAYLPPACSCVTSCYTSTSDVSDKIPPDWRGGFQDFDHDDIWTQDYLDMLRKERIAKPETCRERYGTEKPEWVQRGVAQREGKKFPLWELLPERVKHVIPEGKETCICFEEKTASSHDELSGSENWNQAQSEIMSQFDTISW